jgi:hypothetical protein
VHLEPKQFLARYHPLVEPFSRSTNTVELGNLDADYPIIVTFLPYTQIFSESKTAFGLPFGRYNL